MSSTEAAGKAFSFSLLAYAGVAIAVSLIKNFWCREYQVDEDRISRLPKEDGISRLPKEDGISRLPEEDRVSRLPEEDRISRLPKKDRISQLPKKDRINLLPKKGRISLLPKEDRISQLPDKVLSSIISRLTLNEAVRTSILSRRWRHVYTKMPALRFCFLRMFGEDNHHSPAWRKLYGDKYLKVVDHFLRLYSGHKIVYLVMSICFITEYISDFERWMKDICKMGIQGLSLSFPDRVATVDLDANGDFKVVNNYSFPLELISEAAALLKHLHLSACNLVLTPKVQFNSLKTLGLSSVRLRSGEFESILSSCLNLEKFKIRGCELPPKLSIYSSYQLKFVMIAFCHGAKEIDICAGNLVIFEFSSNYLVKLFFSHVPKLEKMYLRIKGKSTAPYVFRELAKDLPHVNSLAFRTWTDKLEYIDAGSIMFRNLRQLYLVCWHRFEFNLLNVTPIIEACSLLETFHIAVCDIYRYQRSSNLRQILNNMLQTIRSRSNEDRVERTPICHKHLKVVKFGGFLGRPDQLEVALFILRSAIVLDQMVLSNSFKYYTGDGTYNFCHDETRFTKREREVFDRKLQGQAVSNTAKVIILDGPML